MSAAPGGPRVGVVFPSTQGGMSPEDIKAYARAVEELGADHLLVADHVLGADVAYHPDWAGAWDSSTPFREPLALLSFLAGVSNLDLATYVLVLPQRQTVLVAKQAAEVDLLAGGGRLRLGVSVGWNEIEYAGLGIDFADRASRMEQQMRAMRELWLSPALDTRVGEEHVRGAGINPRPAGVIPLWMGGASAPALRRAGRLSDGWMPFPIRERLDVTAFRDQTAVIASAAVDAGRDPADLGLQGGINLSPDMIREAPRIWEDWESVGATHIALNTLRSGSASLQEHLALVTKAIASRT